MSRKIALPFTSRTYVAIAIARGIAAANGHEDLTAAHVLLGIIGEGKNMGAAVLARNIAALQNGEQPSPEVLERVRKTLWSMRHALERSLPETGHPRFGEVVLPDSAGEHEIIDAAVAESASLECTYLGAEHLLLAVLRKQDSNAAQVLATYGITYDTAAEHMRALARGER